VPSVAVPFPFPVDPTGPIPVYPPGSFTWWTDPRAVHPVHEMGGYASAGPGWRQAQCRRGRAVARLRT